MSWTMEDEEILAKLIEKKKQSQDILYDVKRILTPIYEYTRSSHSTKEGFVHMILLSRLELIDALTSKKKQD